MADTPATQADPNFLPIEGTMEAPIIFFEVCPTFGNNGGLINLMLAAGLKGIDAGYELPPEAEANVWTMSPAERAAVGIEPLPASLSEAIDEMERSEVVREALGEHIFEWFLRNKRAEWDLYRAQVTPFELTRYLGSW